MWFVYLFAGVARCGTLGGLLSSYGHEAPHSDPCTTTAETIPNALPSSRATNPPASTTLMYGSRTAKQSMLHPDPYAQTTPGRILSRAQSPRPPDTPFIDALRVLFGHMSDVEHQHAPVKLAYVKAVLSALEPHMPEGAFEIGEQQDALEAMQVKTQLRACLWFCNL